MNKEDFILKKIKVDDAGKCEIAYLKTISDGEVAYSDTILVNSPRICDKDLTDALKKLVPYMADTNHLKPHRNLPKMAGKPQEAIKQLKQVFNQMDSDVHESVIITGISLSGNEDGESLKITGKRKVDHGTLALNTPNIFRNGDSFGFEKKIYEIVDEIKEEVYQYIEFSKSSGVTLFDEENKENAA